MAHRYLLDLYKVLEQRQQVLSDKVRSKELPPEKLAEYQGQLSIIEEFGEYLFTSYNHKLPRRMQLKESPFSLHKEDIKS